MARVFVTDTHLSNIANAIRNKKGTNETYKVSEMAEAIGSISNGNAGGKLNLQNKTIEPTKNVKNVRADSGYDGLGVVTVEAIETEQKTITENGVYTPTEGKYFDEVTVNVPSGEKIIYSTEDGRMYTRNVTIPDGTAKIGPYAFYHCFDLESINLPVSVMSIDNYAFSSTKLKSINLHEGITSIGQNAFSNIQTLETLTLPSTVTTIGLNSFTSCKSLKTVYINEGITTISNSFSSCSGLKNVYLPASLTKIDGNLFLGCSNLEFVTLGNGFSASLKLSASTKYSVDTIITMFNTLGTVTGKTLTLGATNLAKLTNEQKQIATDKGWTLA